MAARARTDKQRAARAKDAPLVEMHARGFNDGCANTALLVSLWLKRKGFAELAADVATGAWLKEG